MKNLISLLLFSVLAIGLIAQATVVQGYSYDVYGKLNTRQSFLAGGTTPVASAIGEFRDTAKGLLVPRLTTTQRTAVSSPAQGLLIYNTTTKAFNCYIDTAWQSVGLATSDSVSIYKLVPTAGAIFYCSNCSGNGVTGRIVSYFGSAWRRLAYN